MKNKLFKDEHVKFIAKFLNGDFNKHGLLHPSFHPIVAAKYERQILGKKTSVWDDYGKDSE